MFDIYEAMLCEGERTGNYPNVTRSEFYECERRALPKKEATDGDHTEPDTSGGR